MPGAGDGCRFRETADAARVVAPEAERPEAERPEKPHPLQQAYVDEQVPQCGYCINGWIMTAAAVLRKTPKATDEELRRSLAGLKCRCGTHVAILRAIKRTQAMLG